MLRRTSLVSIVLAAVLAGAGLARAPLPAGASGGASTPRSALPTCSLPAAATARVGSFARSGLVAVSGGQLIVTPRGSTPARLAVPASAGGMIRHVASDPTFGLAYVEDFRGADTVVIRSGRGVVRLPQRSEATHPTWSPAGDLAWSVGTALRIRSPEGHISQVRAPVRSGSVFSPVFGTTRRLIAVVAGAPTDAVPEDERVNNLWSYDRSMQRWRQITRFTSGADRWTAVRTPVRTPAGAIEFIRITGRGSATREPSFQLWRSAGGSARLVQRLSSERYLATYAAGQRIWNVPDPSTGMFHLVRETSAGREVQLGCGTVEADPLDTVDPDRRAQRGRFTPPRGHWRGLDEQAQGIDEAPAQVAILVGDYATRDEAESAAARIEGAYGATAPVEVVDAITAPEAIRPGVFGAVLLLPVGADVLRSLDGFRARLPEYASSSWVVSA